MIRVEIKNKILNSIFRVKKELTFEECIKKYGIYQPLNIKTSKTDRVIISAKHPKGLLIRYDGSISIPHKTIWGKVKYNKVDEIITITIQ